MSALIFSPTVVWWYTQLLHRFQSCLWCCQKLALMWEVKNNELVIELNVVQSLWFSAGFDLLTPPDYRTEENQAENNIIVGVSWCKNLKLFWYWAIHGSGMLSFTPRRWAPLKFNNKTLDSQPSLTWVYLAAITSQVDIRPLQIKELLTYFGKCFTIKIKSSSSG